MSSKLFAHPDGAPEDRKDLEGYTRWLKMKVHQQTPTGAFARIVMTDTYWTDPTSRQEVLQHLRELSVRGFMIQVASESWTEYEQWLAKGLGKQKARARGKRAKKARRTTRAAAATRRKR